jgi:hypothetical protein
MLAIKLIAVCAALIFVAPVAAKIGPFPSGGIGGGGGNYPALSVGFGPGCSNTRGEVASYAQVSQRGVLWPSYTTDNGFVAAWEKDDGTQVPGTGSLSTPPNSIGTVSYNFWTRFDQQRRTSNPVGGQQLLAVWVNLCDNEYDVAHGVAVPTNAMLDNIFAMLKKHTTDCIATPSNCGESVAPNISPNLKVWVSMINTYKPQSVCFDMNSGGQSAGNSSTNGTISAGAVSVTMTSVNGMSVGGNGGTFSWVLDNGTEAYETISSISGLVVGFSPAIPASRSVVSGTRAYIGDGLGQSTTRSLMQHAIGASYAGFSSVTYGPNGNGQGATFYPTLAAADGVFYPFGPLDATKTPSDLGVDGCHPSTSGALGIALPLANFIDAQIQ